MSRLIDVTGQKINRLTFIKHIEGSKWLCKCDCGEEKILTKCDVLSGNTKSCGCLNKELATDRCKSLAKHNMCKTKEFGAWKSMKERCLNTNNKFYNW